MEVVLLYLVVFLLGVILGGVGVLALISSSSRFYF